MIKLDAFAWHELTVRETCVSISVAWYNASCCLISVCNIFFIINWLFATLRDI